MEDGKMTISNVKKFHKATSKLLEKYVEGLANQWIHKPMAWALYETWRAIDKTEKEREPR